MDINEMKKLVYNRIPLSLQTQDMNKCLINNLELTGGKDSPLLEGLTSKDIQALLEGMSISKNTIILYHGSTDIVKLPEYKKGKENCDYGSGFYCTEDEEAGRLWSVTRELDGFNNRYEIDLSNLKILNLNSNNILEWLAVLLDNRIPSNLDDNIEEVRKRFVTKYNKVNLKDYDIVIGYRADDSYFSIAVGFLTGAIDYNVLRESLVLGDLGMQFTLMSQKAFSSIKYIDNEKCLATKYYEEYLYNDKKARLLFSQLERKSFVKGRKTIVDFL